MLHRSLIKKLFVYNMHLGHYGSSNSDLNSYVLGKRFNFVIFNLNNTFMLLKKALLFIKLLSTSNGDLLFYYSKYTDLSLTYKCVLLSLTTRIAQPIITNRWVYGSVSNYFFSFFYLLQEVTTTWMRSTSFLFNYGKDQNRHYSHSIDDNTYVYFGYLFFSNEDKYEGVQLFDKAYAWYNRWVNLQKSYEIWEYKKAASTHRIFLEQLCLNDINNAFKHKQMLKFKFFFIKLFYYINKKHKDFFLDEEYLETHLSDRLKHYWRVLLYFKHFNNYMQVPDALLSVFPDNNDSPLNEFSSANLVSIGVVDSNSTVSNIMYPIISNDDSFLIVLFYFTLFSSVYLESKLSMYTNLKSASL